MSAVSADIIAAMQAEPYSPANAQRFWTRYEPQMLKFLTALEAREHWVVNGAGSAEPQLVSLITYLPKTGPMPPEALVTLMRVLSALPYGQSIHALLWLDVQKSPAVRDVLRYTFDHRHDNAAANIMWQRLERVSRFHVLSGLVYDLTSVEDPREALERELVQPGAQTEAVKRSARKLDLPALLGNRRLGTMLNEESLPFLNEVRTITSLNEVDELFGNRRFYLLTEDVDLCRSLAPYGVNVDQYGGYVTRGPACDFDHLDALLPFVCRRSIKPLFGDLIPYSSWASNLSRLLTRGSWDRIRRPIIESVGYRCEICGAKESGSDIDCHEQWEYHEPIIAGKRGVQRLVDLWVMCADCHATQHLRRSSGPGGSADALERLRRIGRMSEREAQAYRAFVFDRCEKRNQMKWVLDVSSIAGPEPLLVHISWKLDAQGFLNREPAAGDAGKSAAQTMLLGASWTYAAHGSQIHPARPVEDGYYE